ncbi:MAG: alkaline phosphatase D family protein [Sinobacteraceae bacterium]|nr:alkaline phosphatase D family protein [Nevskiaceae bacterium]
MTRRDDPDLLRRGTLIAGVLSLSSLVLPPLEAAVPGSRPRVLQGPMVGDTGPDYFSIWARISDRHAVAIEYADNPAMRGARRTASAMAEPAGDHVVVLRVHGLDAATVYWYRVLCDGQPDPYGTEPHPVRTAPRQGASLRIAFGSCARLALDAEQPIFRAIAASRPDLFLWLGDNVYVDSTAAHAFADEYNRQRSVPALQPLIRSVPQLATWDDHDYGLNNADRTSPTKAIAFDAFRRYWANPAYGLPEAPGTFFRKHWAGVDFFFLDVRSWRDPGDAADGPGKTQLGRVQKAWLKRELAASTATFKVLISGVGWCTTGGSKFGESWGAYAHERNELLDFVRDRRIGGVFGISGDTHVGELNRIPGAARNSCDFHELVASPLAQPPRASTEDMQVAERLRPVYQRSSNFGTLEFDLGQEPQVTLSLCDTAGTPVWTPLVLAAAELMPR